MNFHHRQREVKFKEAVLRRLYPPSPSPSASPQPPSSALHEGAPSSPISDSIQGLQLGDHKSYEGQDYAGDITSIPDKNSVEEEEKASKTSLSRAQRKRLKTKRLKEAKAKISEPYVRLIGPLLPSSPLVNDHSSTNFTSTTTLDVNHHKEATERNIDVEAKCEDECLFMSKSKRRKLAKRQSSQNDQSRKSFVSVFTADAGKHGFTIKKGPLV